MKTIPLTQGKVAFVSDEDGARIAAHRWYAYLDKRVGRWYAMRKVRCGSQWYTQSMHREVMGLSHSDPAVVDHKDRDNTLLNTRENLRVTVSQNQQNVGKYKNNTSGFKGVSFHKGTGKYQPRIRVKGELISLGVFSSPVEAALAYDAAAVQHHGEFAVTNASLGLLKKPVQSVSADPAHAVA